MAAPPAVRELTQDEVARFVDAMADLKALGVKAEGKDGGRAEGAAAPFAGLAFGAETEATLRRHGFTRQSITEVSYNVSMAWSALELEAHRPEMDEAKKQQMAALESMKGKMSDAQLEQMKKSMGAAEAHMETMTDVPEINRRLVADVRERLLAVLESK